MKKRHFKRYIAPYASSDNQFCRDPNFHIFTFLHLYLSTCLPLILLVHMSTSLRLYLFIFLSISLPLYLSTSVVCFQIFVDCGRLSTVIDGQNYPVFSLRFQNRMRFVKSRKSFYPIARSRRLMSEWTRPYTRQHQSRAGGQGQYGSWAGAVTEICSPFSSKCPKTRSDYGPTDGRTDRHSDV